MLGPKRPDGAFHDGAFECVGNSGLSLWRRSDILKLLDAVEASGKDDFEAWRGGIVDMWFSAQLQSKRWAALQLRGVPNATEAKHFSFESMGRPDVVPVGVHFKRGYWVEGLRWTPESMMLEQSLVNRCPPVASVLYRLSADHGSIS